MDIKDIISQFRFEGELKSVKEFGSGHINSTYIADFGEKRYVIQKINTSVFKKPDELMTNVFSVTRFLKNLIIENGGEPERETLKFIRTGEGKEYLKTTDGECYRAYIFVDNSICHNSADTPEMFKKSGAAFGRFQSQLGDFPADTLFETIPHFHDTPWRYHNEFEPAVMSDKCGRAKNCKNEIAFVKEREGKLYRITDALDIGDIPLRVTHNDTKLNNILFDENTGESLAVIDLDTVMPGSALYDFGDSIRFGASTAAEDEKDLSKVEINLDYFKAYADGYLSEAGNSLTDKEKELLAYSAWLITLECGMRFLTDYLNGDVYFKTDYPEHNLIRARNQLKLVSDMENKMNEMKKIIKSI
ncbi:MAG: aminoglycoside phosphotransferase family protein [Eubacterium sp.]|nr:aminoglycoside phosphotransferase family protein [Eubacterium sp.]